MCRRTSRPYSVIRSGTDPIRKVNRDGREKMLNQDFDSGPGRERRRVQMREVEHNRLEARLAAIRLAANRSGMHAGPEEAATCGNPATRGAVVVTALFR